MANNFEKALPDQDWDDILGISDEFSDEEKLVQKTAYEYSSKELFPRVKEAFKKEIFDQSIIQELGKLGLIAPTIPAKYEGAELNHVCWLLHRAVRHES